MKSRAIQAGVLVSIFVVVFDQILKQIARMHFDSIDLGILQLRYVENTGAAFSMFLGYNAFLLWMGIIIFGVLVYFSSELPLQKQYCIPYGLILGGAFSNLVDRVLFSAVTDFIDFGWWPSFNLADSALMVGAVWLAIVYMKEKK